MGVGNINHMSKSRIVPVYMSFFFFLTHYFLKFSKRNFKMPVGIFTRPPGLVYTLNPLRIMQEALALSPGLPPLCTGEPAVLELTVRALGCDLKSVRENGASPHTPSVGYRVSHVGHQPCHGTSPLRASVSCLSAAIFLCSLTLFGFSAI